MRDSIDSEDLYIDITKTELEQELNLKGREIELLKDQMKELVEVVRAIQLDKKIEEIIVLQTPSKQ
jgi:hypothetical protein